MFYKKQSENLDKISEYTCEWVHLVVTVVKTATLKSCSSWEHPTRGVIVTKVAGNLIKILLYGFPPKDWLFWFEEYFFRRKSQGDPVSEIVP